MHAQLNELEHVVKATVNITVETGLPEVLWQNFWQAPKTSRDSLRVATPARYPVKLDFSMLAVIVTALDAPTSDLAISAML